MLGVAGLTAGVTTVTFNVGEDGQWQPNSVAGANPAGGPLIFRMYAAGGNGGLPEEGIGGAGGGGGALLIGEIASWSASERFDITIAPGGQNNGATRIQRQSTLDAAGPHNGGDAAGIVPGFGAEDYDNDNSLLTNVALRAGANGASVGGAIAAGGGSSGSIDGDGQTPIGQSGGIAVSADGGNGGEGGDGDIGQGGYVPGGGAGGTAEPSFEFASGGGGRIVILVPTLT